MAIFQEEHMGPGRLLVVTAARESMAKRRNGRSLKTSRKRSVPVDWNTLTPVQKYNRVLRIYKQVTAGGADGGVKGVNGSINAVATQLVLDSLGVDGKVVCDIGAADGKFMVCAVLAGAQRVVGVEYSENVGYKLVFEAVKRQMLQEYDIQFNTHWIGSAIEEVRRFGCLFLLFCIFCGSTGCNTFFVLPQFPKVPESPSVVYAFWNGMDPSTQNHILEICARTSSVDSIAVFRNTNWTSPGAGTAFTFLLFLRSLSCNRVFYRSHRVIGRLFRIQVGFKDYDPYKNVCIWCSAHCVDTRQNQGAPAPKSSDVPSPNEDYSSEGRCAALIAMKFCSTAARLRCRSEPARPVGQVGRLSARL